MIVKNDYINLNPDISKNNQRLDLRHIFISTNTKEDMNKLIKHIEEEYNIDLSNIKIKEPKFRDNILDGYEWYNTLDFEDDKQFYRLKLLFKVKKNSEELKNLWKFFDKIKIKYTKNSDSVWFPSVPKDFNSEYKNYIYKSDKFKNKYPIFILTKGRYDFRTTARYLDWCGIDYKIVIEPSEVDLYIEKGQDKNKIIIAPEDFSKRGQGSIPVRNFILEEARKIDKKGRHWILDDNIKGYYRFYKNQRVFCKGGFIFRMIEDYVDRYTNIKIAGHQYMKFIVSSELNQKPLIRNTRVFSSILLSNDILDIVDKDGPIQWRGKYNEDIDLSIRILRSGFCSIIFNCILGDKLTTLSQIGGNTDTIYGVSTHKYGDNFKFDEVQKNKEKKVQQLLDHYPEYVKSGDLKKVYKFQRPHHSFNFKIFNKNTFIWKEGIKEKLINKKNKQSFNYGIRKVKKPDNMLKDIFGR
jgi:hypothetical protein